MIKWLGFILALGLVLRLIMVATVPGELFGDEVDVGYQAYSLFKTGKDLYGQTLPLYIHSLSEWRAPLLMYATVPTIAVFGLNEYGVRLPEVIFGVLGIAILFLLVYKTTNSVPLSLCTSAALSFMPWHIHYSRVAFEVILLINLLMLGTLLFLKRSYLWGSLSFALSLYTYSTSLVFVPLWVGYLSLRHLRATSKGLFLLFILSLPLIYFIFLGPARDRFGMLSLGNSRELIDRIYVLRSQDPSFWSRFFVNKPLTIAGSWWLNYLRAFSLEFLFVRGDPVMRHSIQVIGQLLPLSAPFLLLGLYALVKQRQWMWLVWLVLSPIPASFTSDGGFHATRLFLMVPPLAVVIGMGLFQIKNKLLLTICYLLFALQLIWVGYYYGVFYRREAWRWWHTGYKQIFTSLSTVDVSYNRVFINNTYEPSLIRFLFWTKFDPARFQKDFVLDQPQKDILPGYDGFSLGSKYIFGRFNKPNYSLLPGAVYLISQREEVAGDWDFEKSPPDGVKVISTSRDPYGRPLFYLVTKK